MKILRLIKIAFLVVFGLALVVVGLANMDTVTVQLLPGGLAEAVGITNAVNLPLVVVIVTSIILGIVVGYVVEWLREHRHRKEAKVQRREATRLSKEVAAMKGANRQEKDDVLALIEDTEGAR
ncbi:LapA family protein [Gymnodinialimonas sp. 2305UL16-5]|uniref:LapA family protein n=1 Tax=Gymnodinialimonas mytili TaxID=3126503 RepID=UPI0030AA2724